MLYVPSIFFEIFIALRTIYREREFKKKLKKREEEKHTLISKLSKQIVELSELRKD